MYITLLCSVFCVLISFVFFFTGLLSDRLPSLSSILIYIEILYTIMRHFDTWLLRDPYSIWHYYSTGRRWQETVRSMIQERQICAPQVDISHPEQERPHAVDPYARKMAPQDDCMFLRKLPAEIRLMIYGYVFGDEAVHLVQLKGKVRHVRCSHPSASVVSNRSCCPVTTARWRVDDARGEDHAQSLLYPHTHTSLPESLSSSSLSLLQTCRTIYSEAANIPYSNLAFDVDDLHTFIAFSLTVNEEHLRRIKRLTVQWMPVWQPMKGEVQQSSIFSHTHNDQLWELFWTRVAALRGLEELRLCLDLGRFSGNLSRDIVGGKRLRLAVDEPWVAPMLLVRGLKSFDLGITVKCDQRAKQVMENDLVRDAVTLRDQLQSVLCSSREQCQLADFGIPNLKNPCSSDAHEGRRVRPRLAITSA